MKITKENFTEWMKKLPYYKEERAWGQYDYWTEYVIKLPLEEQIKEVNEWIRQGMRLYSSTVSMSWTTGLWNSGGESTSSLTKILDSQKRLKRPDGSYAYSYYEKIPCLDYKKDGFDTEIEWIENKIKEIEEYKKTELFKNY